ncbi:N-acetylmuramoyl-L-alanine amidase [Bacillus sp. FJAT-45350]|uniref:N-acetylmuramoyl-L-alanine amidase n=1 Tax=Bacillus sp. FJAT-45350 TaxID=2011014 RepID=UPI0015C728E2|nr:N-acetylmuramoyl-L-alanine amidase [Bacillus sp. FJAT-45350]
MKYHRLWLLGLSFLIALSVVLPAQYVSSSFQEGTVKADILNVRSAPSTNGELLGKLTKEFKVQIIEQAVNGEWYKIKYNSQDAFVHSDHIQLNNQSTNQSNRIFVNNEEMVLPTQPLLKDNSLMVPFRVLGEALGIEVQWLGNTRQVLAKDNGTEILFTINSNTVLVNGTSKAVNPEPIIVNSSTLLPLRYFSESFGAKVHWDQATKEVTINRTKQVTQDKTEVSPIESPSIDKLVSIGQVQPTTLNVRKGPGTEFDIIDSLRKGSTVNIVEHQGDWAKIIYANTYAYVHRGFLAIEEGTVEEPDKKNENTNGKLAGKTIVVDPGHGGKDPGATAFGVMEKEIVLRTGLELQKMLEEAGAKIVMTRSNDTFIELSRRVEIANNAKADSFISIHANAAGNQAAHGTETYWNRNHSNTKSKELAEKIQKELIKKLKTNNRGVKEANFQVIRHTTMPSVLVELGFITNEAEAKRMSTEKFHKEAAEAIFEGVIEFYK